MKTLDLNNYGVQEMNAVEMRATDGGNPLFWFIGAVAAGFAYDLWKDFAEAVMDGYADGVYDGMPSYKR